MPTTSQQIRELEDHVHKARRDRAWWRSAAILLAMTGMTVPLVVRGLGNVPNLFSSGTPIVAAEVNANFEHVVDGVSALETDTANLEARVASIESAPFASLPAVSDASGIQTVTTGSLTAMASVSVTLTSVGNPVLVGFIPDGSGDLSMFEASPSGSSSTVRIERDGTPICLVRVSDSQPPSAVRCLDQAPPAGTRVYSASLQNNGTQSRAIRMRMMAYEFGPATP